MINDLFEYETRIYETKEELTKDEVFNLPIKIFEV